MGLPRFFPEQTIHRFEYRPLFYDEIKDDIAQRRAAIRKELGKEDAEDVRILRKGTFTRMYERKHTELRNSNKRVFVLAICIGLIVYFVNRYYGFF